MSVSILQKVNCIIFLCSHLFVSDWGSQGRIERCRLNGQNCTVIVGNLGWPNGIVLDFNDGMIIWTDAKYSRIEMALRDGSHRRIAVR